MVRIAARIFMVISTRTSAGLVHTTDPGYASQILCPVNSRLCNNGMRTVQIHSDYTQGYVRIEGKRAVASSSDNFRNHTLQLVTIDRHYFLMFDPNANMFICWNKSFTNLLPRRNPRNLRYCKFAEKISIKHPTDKVRYTTTYTRGGETRESELRFNRNGNYASQRLLKNCLEKKKKSLRTRYHHPTRHYIPTIDVQLMMNVDTLNITPVTMEAYGLVSKFCADSDFVTKELNIDDCGRGVFCKKMDRIHKHHPIACELSSFCLIKNKKCGGV